LDDRHENTGATMSAQVEKSPWPWYHNACKGDKGGQDTNQTSWSRRRRPPLPFRTPRNPQNKQKQNHQKSNQRFQDKQRQALSETSKQKHYIKK
jgi:hypothetical protein